MSTYLLWIIYAAWDWVLAPPLRWALTLSREWQLEFGLLLFVCIFWRRMIESYFIGSRQLGSWWAEKRRLREWYAYARMSDSDFRAVIDAIRRKADREESLARQFLHRSPSSLTGRVLWKAADHRREHAIALRDEASRLERLWQAIEKERGGPGDKAGMRAKVLRLMRRLDAPNDATALSALAELNRINHWFDWLSLAPAGMGVEKFRLVQLLRTMAETSDLHTARNAHSGALRMLQDINQEWEWLTA